MLSLLARLYNKQLLNQDGKDAHAPLVLIYYDDGYMHFQPAQGSSQRARRSYVVASHTRHHLMIKATHEPSEQSRLEKRNFFQTL